MTQITLTHSTYPALTAQVTASGVSLHWNGWTESARDISWEDMDDGEKLCQIFQDQRVAEFVVIAKFLADAYAKRSAFQEVQW
jgi:hypothetical protein